MTETRAEIARSVERWKAYCDTVQRMTGPARPETPAMRDERVRRLRSDYQAFVDWYFPHYTTGPDGRRVPCAPFHREAAELVLRNRNLRAAFVWHRGAAKSATLDIFIPLWLKCQEEREIRVMVLVGKSEDNARTLLSDIQAELQYNRLYISDFGVQTGGGSWEEGRFVTRDGTAFFALGRGQSPRGLRHRSSRPDYIVMDDLDDDELCANPSRVSRLSAWMKEALFGALDGGRGRFLMAGNLISRTSALASFCDSEGVRVSRVNILDEEGGVSWAARWSREEVRSLETFQGYRSFQKEYMNNPVSEGAVFRADWIRWGTPPAWGSFDDLVLYVDPSFKGTDKSDYKACKLWGREGTRLWCLKAFVRQCGTGEMIRWLYDLYERTIAAGAAVKWYMEAGFMQDMLLDEFRREGDLRGRQLPVMPDRRKKPDKFQRVESVSPLWERGFVFYDEAERKDPDMRTGVEQTLSFEKGMRGHDDGPDADEGAIWFLQRDSREARFAPSFGRRAERGGFIW